MDWLNYLELLLPGIWVTVQLTIYSTILGAIFSFAFGLGKLSNNWLIKLPSATFVEIFRGTSLLVQMFWLFYALPIIGHAIGIDARIPPIIAGILALSANIGAYGAEVVRGAVLAVSKDQYEAALAMNFTPRQTLWRIALPQALPEMMPPFGNLAIQNLKDTSLVSLITIADMAFLAQRLRNLTADSITIYTIVLFLYFFMSLFLAYLMGLLAKRIGTWRSTGRS
ncbi:MAG TPA: ectoine/hydroxyectoine ABC transporter permease subunit EhuC [Salinisphaeraceae bacterium]|nr:ectoine/hydroxyectoine ABC transporter permease subunit EhuC [Salinisphaeraceae bacterium]